MSSREHLHTEYSKGRIELPPSFRDFAEDNMILTTAVERCLYIFPLSWAREEQLVLAGAAFAAAVRGNFAKAQAHGCLCALN